MPTREMVREVDPDSASEVGTIRNAPERWWTRPMAAWGWSLVAFLAIVTVAFGLSVGPKALGWPTPLYIAAYAVLAFSAVLSAFVGGIDLFRKKPSQ